MKIIARFLSFLGPFSLSVVAHVLARLVFSVLRVRRELVLANLGLAFGSSMSKVERVATGYSSVYNFILTIVEFLASRGNISNNVSFEGEEHLKVALEQGRGAYILCCHLGSWEAMGAAMNKKFGPTYVIVKRVGSESMNRFVCEQRERNEFRIIKRSGRGTASKAIRAALDSEEIVGFVMDQARPSEPKLDFFGHPAKTNTGFAAIWRKNQAPVLAAHIERTSVGHHIVKIGKEIPLSTTDSLENDIITLTNKFNHEVEKLVVKKPDQYFWMHNRWKT